MRNSAVASAETSRKVKRNKCRQLFFFLLVFLAAGFFVRSSSIDFVKAQEQSEWVLKSPMPTARSAPASGVIDDKIYVAGGSDASGQALSDLEVYDPDTDSWEVKAPMTVARWGLASGIIDGKYYVVMGGSPIPDGTPKTEMFDPAANQWSEKSNMPNPGWGVASGVINNRLYVIGGYNWPNWGMDYNREYDPITNQWTMKAPMPTKRSWLAAEVIGNKLYAIGGWNENDTVDLPTLEVYNPTSDTWISKTNMPAGLRNVATAVLDDKLYVFGGFSGEGPSATWHSSVFVYDQETDAWSQLSDLPTPIAGATAETINGNIYLIGGSTQNATLDTTYVWQLKQEPDPVIIVPGIMGSWRVAGEWRLDPILHTYDNLMEALIVAGYEEGQDLFTFPYEWRADNNLTADLLQEKIQQIKQTTGKDKVDIVAHSMGGLVTRSYVQGDDYQNDIDQVIFLGTPHKGSPESYLKYEGAAFIEKWDWLKEYLFKIEAASHGYLDLVDYIRVQVLSVEQLLPVYDYLKDKQPDNLWQLRVYPFNYPQNHYLEDLNSEERVDLLKQRVSIINVISDLGINSTLNYLRVISDPDLTDNKWSNGYPENLDQNLNSLEQGNGDGTVPLSSVDSLDGIEVIATSTSDHANLPTIMQKEVIQTLTGKVPENYYNNKITSTIKRWLFFRVYSPVDFAVVAPDGQRIGKDFDNNSEINEIPDAFYSGFENVAEFVLIPNPEDGQYQIEVQGVESGGDYILAGSYIDDNLEFSQTFSGSIIPEQQGDFTIDFNKQTEDPIGELEPVDVIPPVIVINRPQPNQQYWRNQDLIIDYVANDDFSGVATTTITIDDQEVDSVAIDLFDYSLGSRFLKITALDQANNLGQAQVNFQVIANIESTISDINEIYQRGWLKSRIYKTLLVDAFKLLDIKLKSIDSQIKVFQDLIIKAQNNPKLSTAVKQKLINQYNQRISALKIGREKLISNSLDLIVKSLNLVKKLKLINQLGYDIIINDINYLRINLSLRNFNISII